MPDPIIDPATSIVASVNVSALTNSDDDPVASCEAATDFPDDLYGEFTGAREGVRCRGETTAQATGVHSAEPEQARRKLVLKAFL